MRRFFSVAALFGVLAVTAACYAQTPTTSEVETKFAKILRNTKITSIKEAPAKGLYEVIAGPNVFYYSPAGEGHLVFGQIVDKNGTNLTAEIQNKLRAEAQKQQEERAKAILKDLPLDKAIKVGNGPNVIIEFTDPDCPFCRRVDEFLVKRTDITRYVFLHPLDQLHPNARAKSIYALSSKDQAAALREIFSTKYDKGGLPITSADFDKHADAVERLAAGMEVGRKIGVQGTPLLFVNGSMVNGADTNKIQQLLKK